MQPDPRFLNQPMVFWANVRTISQAVGYTERSSRQIRIPSRNEISSAYRALGLTTAHLWDTAGEATAMGSALHDYFVYRAEVLNTKVQYLLMDAPEAKERLALLMERVQGRHPLAMNKQKGEKAGPSPLTNAVNLVIQEAIADDPCDFDPRVLTTFTRGGVPVRTLARRVDGAYPGTTNPIAIWEIKEYYYTTTFGSRVADGVYETLLDGLELEELRKEEGIACEHLLFVDSHNTWWNMGRSYLCRMIDIMHMGYVTEVIFGREVYQRLPMIAEQWRSRAAQRIEEATTILRATETDGSRIFRPAGPAR